MAQPSIRANIHQALDIHRNLTPQTSLDVVIVFDHMPEFGHILVRESMHPRIRIDAGFLKYLRSGSMANPKNITQANFNPFAFRQINSSYSCQFFLLRS